MTRRLIYVPIKFFMLWFHGCMIKPCFIYQSRFGPLTSFSNIQYTDNYIHVICAGKCLYWNILFASNFGVTCSITTLPCVLLTIYTNQMCFRWYIFPWKCVWEGCIVILLSHDSPKQRQKYPVVEWFSVPHLSQQWWFRHGFRFSWALFSSGTTQPIICAIGRAYNDFNVFFCFMHTIPSNYHRHTGLLKGTEHTRWTILWRA